jgi:Ca2+/Na+ antiporter
MIQRVQSIYLFFNVLAVILITYTVPVLFDDTKSLFVTDFLLAHIAALITVLLSIISIFKYKNRSHQLMINQVSKLFLSATFFILFIQKGEFTPDKGMVLFIIPYILILLANWFIKKDEKLVKSADRIR